MVLWQYRVSDLPAETRDRRLELTLEIFNFPLNLAEVNDQFIELEFSKPTSLGCAIKAESNILKSILEPTLPTTNTIL